MTLTWRPMQAARRWCTDMYSAHPGDPSATLTQAGGRLGPAGRTDRVTKPNFSVGFAGISFALLN